MKAVLTYDQASSWLRQGRMKHERSLYYGNYRIWKENRWSHNSDLCIGWTGHSYVTLHYDGTTTIQGNSVSESGIISYHDFRNSYSIRQLISRYAGVNVYRKNHKLYLETNEADISPPKIQACRSCSSTGKVHVTCFLETCWGKEKSMNGFMWCDVHPDLDLMKPSLYNTRRHHDVPCEHGREEEHTLYRAATCSACNGERKRDYGSKLIPILWNGGPIKLRDGKIINTPVSQFKSNIEWMVKDDVENVREV